MRKVKLFLLCLFIMTALCACGGEKAHIANILNGEEGGAWETCSVELLNKSDGYLKSVKANAGKIVYAVTSDFTEYYYCVDNVEKLPMESFCAFNTETTDVLDFDIDYEGNIIFMLLESLNNEENIYLRSYSDDGEFKEIKLLNDFHKGNEDECYQWKVKASPDGNYLVYSQLGYLLLEQSGRMIREDSWLKCEVYDCCYISADYLLLHYYVDYKSMFARVDAKKGEVENLETIPEFTVFDFIQSTVDSLYMYTPSGLYKYRFDNKFTENVLQWSNYGIAGDDIIKIYNKDGELHCLLYKEQCLYDIKWRQNESVKQRKELVLGCVGEQTELRRAVADFNNSNNEVVITITDFLGDDENLAVNNMFHAVLSGKGPDIIKFDSRYMDDRILEKGDVLEDLTPFLVSSDIIKEEDIIDSIAQMLHIDGRIYMLPTNFNITALITNSNWISEGDRPTVNDLMRALEETCDLHAAAVSQNHMLEMCAAYGLYEVEGSEARSAVIMKFLELARKLPQEVIYEPQEAVRIKGYLPFEECRIDNMKTFLYHKSAWGKDGVFTGFPEAKGNGMAIVPKNCFGISSESEYKAEAWDFIEGFFSEEWQNSITPNYDFSILKEKFEDQMREAMQIDYYDDGSGKMQEVPVLSYYTEGAYIDVFAARAEDVATINKMLNEAEILERDASPVANILQEEGAYYFAGAKSLEDVLGIIENRLKLLTAEQ